MTRRNSRNKLIFIQWYLELCISRSCLYFQKNLARRVKSSLNSDTSSKISSRSWPCRKWNLAKNLRFHTYKALIFKEKWWKVHSKCDCQLLFLLLPYLFSPPNLGVLCGKFVFMHYASLPMVRGSFLHQIAFI